MYFNGNPAIDNGSDVCRSSYVENLNSLSPTLFLLILSFVFVQFVPQTDCICCFIRCIERKSNKDRELCWWSVLFLKCTWKLSCCVHRAPTDNIVSTPIRNYVKMPKSTKYYGELLIFQCASTSKNVQVVWFCRMKIHSRQNQQTVQVILLNQPTILLTKCARSLSLSISRSFALFEG